MSALNELGRAVRIRRSDMGLSQNNVAKLCGLSRTTVNQIENGTIQDLSIKRATRLVDALGLRMSVSGPHKLDASAQSGALEKVTRIANVSYRTLLTPEVLRQSLLTGEVHAEYSPHIRAALEEAPIALLASAVEQLHLEESADRHEIWVKMRTMARALQSYREVWL